MSAVYNTLYLLLWLTLEELGGNEEGIQRENKQIVRDILSKHNIHFPISADYLVKHNKKSGTKAGCVTIIVMPFIYIYALVIFIVSFFRR